MIPTRIVIGRNPACDIVLDDPYVSPFHAPAARVLAVYDRAVLLTDTERRRLVREWGAFDILAGVG